LELLNSQVLFMLLIVIYLSDEFVGSYYISGVKFHMLITWGWYMWGLTLSTIWSHSPPAAELHMLVTQTYVWGFTLS